MLNSSLRLREIHSSFKYPEAHLNMGTFVHTRDISTITFITLVLGFIFLKKNVYVELYIEKNNSSSNYHCGCCDAEIVQNSSQMFDVQIRTFLIYLIIHFIIFFFWSLSTHTFLKLLMTLHGFRCHIFFENSFSFHWYLKC